VSILLVVDRVEDWPLDIPEVEVTKARSYLRDAELASRRGLKVFNLCRNYRYQSLGYYVSLLAEARGHRPLPSVATVQDLRHRSLLRLVSEDLEATIQRSLATLAGDEFELSVYFGRNVAARHRRLALALFNLFPVPLSRARFFRSANGWELRSLRPIAAREIPPGHHDFVVEVAREFFGKRRTSPSPSRRYRYDLAILVNPREKEPPSDEVALRRFVKAGHDVGFDVQLIEPEDYGRLAEFDALFLRETTHVQHHTYRFARRAEAEGLVVLDDPGSILRCTNKVFLAEALHRAGIPTPATWIVDRQNLTSVAREMTYPAILKLPDGSFSRGLSRVASKEELIATARGYLDTSDLVLAQEFVPTEFDWRIGILAGEVLYAARYAMAKGHWQIIQRDAQGRVRHYGGVEAVPVGDVPDAVRLAALGAAALMGDGLYGVDLKSRDDRVYVIEVNDNPTLESGMEDSVIGADLYRRIMEEFLRRVERRKERR
jgi:glutathione synthase/RimK-type ligase-like ATP-grasp enzyme